jgi:hypothetical protein
LGRQTAAGKRGNDARALIGIVQAEAVVGTPPPDAHFATIAVIAISLVALAFVESSAASQ